MPDPAPLAVLLPRSVGPYAVLVLLGFGIGALGHLSSSRRLVAIGVGLIVAGAFLLPLALSLSGEAPPSPELPAAPR